MTREEMEGLRDYLDKILGVAETYDIKLTKAEVETIVSALDEVISF